MYKLLSLFITILPVIFNYLILINNELRNKLMHAGKITVYFCFNMCNLRYNGQSDFWENSCHTLGIRLHSIAWCMNIIVPLIARGILLASEPCVNTVHAMCCSPECSHFHIKSGCWSRCSKSRAVTFFCWGATEENGWDDKMDAQLIYDTHGHTGL